MFVCVNVIGVTLLLLPGVMMPVVKDADVALKLAITGMCSQTTQCCGVVPSRAGRHYIPPYSDSTGMLQDHLIGEELLADYLLYSLNKNKVFE